MPQPFYFGPRDRPLFAWLHRPAAPASDLGLLLCGPLGHEAISCHRTLRHLAEAAAARGIPALRFDYDGTGDSAGSDADPARLAAWIRSIGTAARELRARTGVRRICVFGIRLGASLALLAAQDLPEVSAVALAGTVVEGRRYLRELRALAATSALPMDGARDADIEAAAGFITTAATRRDIGALRLAGEALQRAPARVLLLDRADLPADATLPERLRQLGSDVSRRPFHGYVDMLRDPHETRVPRQEIAAVLDWLAPAGERSGALAEAPPASLPDHCEMGWSDNAVTGHVREQAMSIGPGIFCILAESADAAPGGAVLVLLNSGAVHHVGPNRLYVRIARELALRGMKVLRVDLPGLGDSPVPAGAEENQSYPDHALAAVASIVDHARRSLDATVVHCAGICSGAYHSLKAAIAGQSLCSVVVINPLTFHWKRGMSLMQPAYQDTGRILRMRREALSGTFVRKVLASPSTLLQIARTLARYSVRIARAMGRQMARALGIRLREDLARDLRAVGQRGTRMHFVFAATDPGHALLREHAGREVRRLLRAGVATVDFIEAADHTFTPPDSQQALVSRITQLVAG